MKVTKEKSLKIIVLTVCMLIFSALILWANQIIYESDIEDGLYFERGRVTGVVRVEEGLGYHRQVLFVEVITGEFSGMVIEAENNLLDFRMQEFSAGDRVVVSLSENLFLIDSPDRGNWLLVMVAVFFVLLCIIGGKKGLFSLLSIIFSLSAIIFILVPLTLAGQSAITIALVVGVLMIIVNVVLVTGVNIKSITAILGCITGVVFSALFAGLVGYIASVSGYHTEHAGMLLVWSEFINLSGIFIAGVIISSIGAITDTAMTIASSMDEIKKASPQISIKELAKSGLNVGRDVMGTMSNTLILAFVGSSFSLILLIFSLDVTWIQFINNDEVGIEIIQGIAGSIGIVLTVPITTLVAAKLFSGINDTTSTSNE